MADPAAAPPAATADDPVHQPPGQGHATHDAALVLSCLGVVYGDIGTSPLYALRESLVHAHEHGMADTAVIGIVSMLFWTVVLIVTLKYVVLILRADNNGEGGTLSLVAKAQEALGRRAWWLYLLGIVGVSLFFGDSMITPAISVLSAVEGLSLVVPGFERWVVPSKLGIVIALVLRAIAHRTIRRLTRVSPDGRLPPLLVPRGARGDPPAGGPTCRWRSRPPGSGGRARSRRPPSRR